MQHFISRICTRFLKIINTGSSYNCPSGFSTVIATTKAEEPVNKSTLLLAEEITAPKLVSKIRIKKPKKRVKSQELLDYISQNAGTFTTTAISELLPVKFVRSSSTIPTTVYLINDSTACEIAEVIESQNLDLEAPAIELNAGIGLLTSQLTNKLGFKNLTCFEEQVVLGANLKEQFQLPIVQKNFADLPRLHHVDKVDGGNRVSNVLSLIKVPLIEKEAKKKNLYVFGAIPHLSTINFTIKSLVTQKILYEDDWAWNNPIYYVALGSRAYWVLTSSPSSGFFSYRPSAVAFQILFKTTLYKTLPRKAFIPWINDLPEEKKTRKFLIQNDFDPDLVYFVKIETNRQIVEKLGKENLLQFWYFVRQHLFSRKNFVIPELEQWIPGCGPKLIRQGFSIYTQFGELTPDQILDIYLQFISWPEFPGSSFLNAVEKFQLRIERQDEDVMEFHKSP